MEAGKALVRMTRYIEGGSRGGQVILVRHGSDYVGRCCPAYLYMGTMHKFSYLNYHGSPVL